MRDIFVTIGRGSGKPLEDTVTGWVYRDTATDILKRWRVQGRRVFRKRVDTAMGPAIRYRIWFANPAMGSHTVTILRKQAPSTLSDAELLAALV